MAAIHSTPFEGAGKTFDWNSQQFHCEDYWDRIYGESWAWSRNNPAALKYAVRTIGTDLPDDDEVVYGKDSFGLGHLVHVSELKAHNTESETRTMSFAFPHSVSTGSYTIEQLEGETCASCGRPFAIGEPSRPSERILCHQLFVHVKCLKVGASR